MRVTLIFIQIHVQLFLYIKDISLFKIKTQLWLHSGVDKQYCHHNLGKPKKKSTLVVSFREWVGVIYTV